MSNWGLLATADEILSQQEHSTSDWNESAFSDPRVDAAIEAARSENDPTKRYEYYAQAQEIIVNEGGRIIPYFRPALSAARSNVNGLTPSPLELMHFYSVWLA
jgi:peptide/nickel transport system substrate-binding protein